MSHATIKNTEGRDVRLPESIVAKMPPHLRDLFVELPNPVLALFGNSTGQIARTSSSTRKNQSCYGEMRRGNADSEQDPRCEIDTSAVRFFNAFPLEPEAIYYHAKARSRDRVYQCRICLAYGVGDKPNCECVDETGKRSLRGHPTVKPIGLIEHLVRLITPPGGTVLDPFAGTGTTGAAARNLGFDCVLMEADEESCGYIRARLGLADPNPAPSPAIAAIMGGQPSDPMAALGL